MFSVNMVGLHSHFWQWPGKRIRRLRALESSKGRRIWTIKNSQHLPQQPCPRDLITWPLPNPVLKPAPWVPPRLLPSLSAAALPSLTAPTPRFAHSQVLPRVYDTVPSSFIGIKHIFTPHQSVSIWYFVLVLQVHVRWFMCFLKFEMRSHYVAQAALNSWSSLTIHPPQPSKLLGLQMYVICQVDLVFKLNFRYYFIPHFFRNYTK